LELKRHNLVEITDSGRKKIFSQLQKTYESPIDIELIARIVVEGYGSVKIPGIIRREEMHELNGIVPAGFSSPFLNNGKRLRIPVLIPEEDVVEVVTPYDVLNHGFDERTKCLKALHLIKAAALDMGISLGVWGSACLEVHTGLPYTHEGSDLDLLVGITDFGTIKNFYLFLNRMSRQYEFRIDSELDWPGGYGIQVAELFMDTETVLGKGIRDVKLIPKKEIIDSVHY